VIRADYDTPLQRISMDHVNEANELWPSLGRAANSQWLRYVEMRANGESARMAEMLATRSFPGIHGSDSTFMKGTHYQETQLDEYRHREAAARGVDTNGRRYIAGLARYPNDPEAWVSDRSDVLRVCRDRGWSCDGLVEFKAPPAEAPPQDTPIGEDILESHVQACLRGYDPAERTPRLTEDIREACRQELTGEVDLGGGPKVSDWELEDAIALSSD
jgi:hypothetical protein